MFTLYKYILINTLINRRRHCNAIHHTKCLQRLILYYTIVGHTSKGWYQQLPRSLVVQPVGRRPRGMPRNRCVPFTLFSPTCGRMPLSAPSLWPGRQSYRPRLVGGMRGGGTSSVAPRSRNPPTGRRRDSPHLLFSMCVL